MFQSYRSSSNTMSTLKHSILQVHPHMNDFNDYISRRPFVHHYKPHELLPEFQKSAALASELRKLGNEAYKSKAYDEALLYYSKSVANAPSESVELALAFGNRSATLQRLKKHALCLLDVNRALKGPNLPDNTTQKLVDRKIDCWARLQSENDTKQKLRKAIKTKEKRALYPTERRWLYGHQMTKDETDFKMDYSSFDDPIWRTTFDNDLAPGLSKNVELAHNEEYGCHLVATKDIKPGEVISIQEVFTLVLLPDEKILHSYCSYCSILCEALIPCSNCTVEMYCSRACRQNAYDSYHRTECKLLPYMMSGKVDRKRVWVPLRIFLAGTKQGLELEKLMLNPDVLDILSGKKRLANTQNPTNDYIAILHMLWRDSEDNDASISCPPRPKRIHEKTKKDVNLENLLYTFELLEHIRFFDEMEKNLENPDLAMNLRLFSVLLLLQHIKATNVTLAVDISLMKSSPSQVMQTEDEDVACCAGLLQGFMNHSCNGNSLYIFNRRNVLTFSTRQIKSGEQIFTTYGMLYGDYPQTKRSEFLADIYGFECKCEACLNNWPTVDDLVEQKTKYRTKAEEVIEKLENHRSWLVGVTIDEGGVYNYKDGDLEKVLKFNEFIRQNVKEPSVMIYLSEAIMDTFMRMKGNCYFTGVQNYTISPYLNEK